MKNKILFICVIFALFSCSKQSEKQIQPPLAAVYNEPAMDWESEALPIGNGYMGAMLFGGVHRDVLQINENTLWSGGFGVDSCYDGGFKYPEAQTKENLIKVQKGLQERMNDFERTKKAYRNAEGELITNDYPGDGSLVEMIHGIMGSDKNFGSYETLGNIVIDYPASENRYPQYENYERKLCLDQALHTVTYIEDGVKYTRESFMSYPDNMLVMRLKADKKGKISRIVSVNSVQPQKTIRVDDGNTITMTGRPTNHKDFGMRFAQQVKVQNKGGVLAVRGDSIVIDNADEVLILMTAGTNYIQSQDDRFQYFSPLDPLDDVKERIAKVSELGFDALFSEHIADYSQLYDRVKINLGDVHVCPSKTTDQLLVDFNSKNTPEEDRYIEMLYYQMGRYLLIASSRPNTLAANLQGVWAEGLNPPWQADYHTNINIQMNYWPASQTNLSECHIPVVEYIKSLVPSGRRTAQYYHVRPSDGLPSRGWVVHHISNIWGKTTPSDYYFAFWFPTAAGWVTQDVWEYYQFTQDKDFLSKHFYILLEASLYWVDTLWEDERDGQLVANPSFSPEHGEYSLGASCDQAIITELFDMTLRAADVLDIKSNEIEEIRLSKSRLAGPQIGLGGQFMEWKDEVTRDVTGDNHHRHVNHLFWLHPGSQIVVGRSPEEDRFVEAMKKTLNTRGDEGTGWSRAWKVNFWARLRDGNRAHKLLQSALDLVDINNTSHEKGGVYKNLLDTHPPYQIDGNFGATAGMTEMLLQSPGGYIELLPALPEAWSDGLYKGLKARGNFEIDICWKNGCASDISILSNSGVDCIIKYPEIEKYIIKESGRIEIVPTVVEPGKISFPTRKDIRYDFKLRAN